MSDNHTYHHTSASSQHAKRRLLCDLREIQRELRSNESLSSVVSALPTSDMFLWHANLRPSEGPYAGAVFHLTLEFPQDYPCSPPSVGLVSTNNLDHPNVFNWDFGGASPYICLDVLKTGHANVPYAGWSPAYSVLSILLQLQSFLFTENVPQDSYSDDGVYFLQNIANPVSVKLAIDDVKRYSCHVKTMDGEKVTHSHRSPWPPLTTIGTGKDGGGSVLCRNIAALRIKEKPSESVVSRSLLFDIPSEVYASLFGFLDDASLLHARNVCSIWRRVIVTYNLWELRAQSYQCFFTKSSLESSSDVVLGIGLDIKKKKQRGTTMQILHFCSSPLDVLSLEAFQDCNVRTGVWAKENFQHFLPLVLNEAHARRAIPIAKKCIFDIMRNVAPSAATPVVNSSTPSSLKPYMILHLLSALMNHMVVSLMKDADSSDGSASSQTTIQRHASEKALEGYCAFHHLLLYFAVIYPEIRVLANQQVENFFSSPENRHKSRAPDLGSLIVCMTLSVKGWKSMWKPLMLETFDRHVRWLLSKHQFLANHCDAATRLHHSFQGSITSLRLLMFQVYFLDQIGRPAGTQGPEQVLQSYNRRLGRPTTEQKEGLQDACRRILSVSTWVEFFALCRVPCPPSDKLFAMLNQAVQNSLRKGYHHANGGRKNGPRRSRK